MLIIIRLAILVLQYYSVVFLRFFDILGLCMIFEWGPNIFTALTFCPGFYRLRLSENEIFATCLSLFNGNMPTQRTLYRRVGLQSFRKAKIFSHWDRST